MLSIKNTSEKVMDIFFDSDSPHEVSYELNTDAGHTEDTTEQSEDRDEEEDEHQDQKTGHEGESILISAIY